MIDIPPYSLQIRFSDCDMMGHINNAVYLNFFESARIHYFKYAFGEKRDWKKNGMIVRVNEIEYLSPIHLDDQPTIELYVENIGTKSFTINYEIRVGNELKTIGKSILVWYNSEEQISFPIPDSIRESLEQLKRY